MLGSRCYWLYPLALAFRREKVKKKERHDRTTVDILEEMRKEVNETVNKYIKEVAAKQEENRKAKDDEDDGKATRKIEDIKDEDEQAQETRNRERESEEMVIENISFDLSKV